MQVIKNTAILKALLHQQRSAGKKIGFVPTMGALHRGHLSLVERCSAENDFCVCSIYVNPKQFNNSEDLDRYPRDLEGDLEMLENIGCDVVFAPSDQEMYPDNNEITIHTGVFDNILEGPYRPGHFGGVCLVVSKLFNIVRPDSAYFGQKDLQQLLLIKQLNEDLSFGIDIVRVDTVREQDGLAMSSRNRRLSAEGREKAAMLYKNLQLARRKLFEGAPVELVKQSVQAAFCQAGPDVRLDYFELLNVDTHTIADTLDGAPNVYLCIAAFVENVRLIDNLSIN
jgi:pantoate--beta-alanine ligase